MADTTTNDMDVVIESDVLLPDEIDPVSGKLGSRAMTYRSLSTGRRWSVVGICDRRGDCLVGSTVNGSTIVTKADLESALVKSYEKTRTYDTPVAPGFSGCCPFVITEL